ncbi:MAG: phospho-N-acetylmuramoyl-pentapeptide-transferase, partial [Oscillospiraceae bacterium]|nr:phospho-N-acetylmuramoyl-pentapeptide-transferase [Oscillospiraceae bacterium]
MTQTVLAALVAFAVTAAVGKPLIALLHRLHAGQSIKSDGPAWHMAKQGTPTMGGLMFILGIAAAVLLAGLPQLLAGELSALFVLAFALVFGAIGFVDDWAKVKKHENTGLSAPQKFLLQLAAAVAFTALLRLTGHLTPNLYIPFFNVSLALPWVVYMIFAAFVMVGCVNAVNITDGVDGLAAGVTVPVALFYTAVCVLWGKTALGGFSGALLGG